MKKFYLISLFVILMVFVTGCSGGSRVITIGSLDSNNNSITGHYSSFSGNYFKTKKFNKNEIVNFKYDVTTESGELTAKLINSDHKIVAELDKDQSIKIKKTDTYKIQVEGNKHKGSFSLTWEENK